VIHLKRLFVAVASLAALLMAPTANAQFLGKTVDVDYFFPNLGSLYETHPGVVVGAGAEIILNGSPFDISDTNLLWSLGNQSGQSFTLADFNGYVLTDSINNLNDIIGVTINGETNLTGFTASGISFDADHIWVTFPGGAVLAPDTVVSLDVTFAPSEVPEPGTLAMLVGVGTSGVALLLRKRRA
jgi:hypothetical protein